MVLGVLIRFRVLGFWVHCSENLTEHCRDDILVGWSPGRPARQATICCSSFKGALSLLKLWRVRQSGGW